MTGCNLPGAYGWPSIPLHLSYTKTAQTQFTLAGGDGESETNFPRPADRRVRNHAVTETLRDQRTVKVQRARLHSRRWRTLPTKSHSCGSFAAHPVSHPLQFISLAPFQSQRYPPFGVRARWRSWEHRRWGGRGIRGVCPSLHSCTDLRSGVAL